MQMAARWINVALGAWLFLTGLVAGPQAPSFADHLAVGMAIFLVAFMSMGIPRLRHANALLGGWMALSPFVFHYMAGRFAFHDIVVGILVFWAASTPPRLPHGGASAPPALP
jgi:hypothetical protein